MQYSAAVQNLSLCSSPLAYGVDRGLKHYILYGLEYDQWRLVVKLAGRAAKFHLWLNVWDCRPGCFYNIVAFPVTPAVLILSNS